ncbi:2-dehydropantoate 2-reductase [Bacillus sp. EKM208B]|nr:MULTISPECIES: 2-dehydropantoate 2-reductase [Bacillus amyloliquefaciens group]KAF6537638.1 2-dehydropantoate 2-reductase [Bacillus sp. EKM208B]AUS16381.1 2-dehydropantoate 2-reductase [Bacillus velezensis]MBU0443349.1 2-dehydropantoate 2-reductase [Bacillus amyloliquefaciens]MCO6397980.1 2-dehydropantoate 2-reductase [Bacillus velezensis]NMP62158.1 2-dehydropantoate 2-reductase [Bacillus velezensis]
MIIWKNADIGCDSVKIGIIGGGAVGLLCAYYLSSRHQVTVITRRTEQADAINSGGIRLLKDGIECTAACRAQTGITSGFDLLIAAVKQHQLSAVLRDLETIKGTNVLFLQNGMGHIHDMKDWHTDHSLYAGTVEHGAKKISDHAVEHTGAGAVRWSVFSASRPETLKSIFSGMHRDFPVYDENDWYRLLTGKLIINVCINPLTALLRVKNGELLRNDAYKKYMRNVFEEAETILGLADREKAWNKVCEVCRLTEKNHSSMLVDIMAGRRTEVDAIIGYLVKEAESRGLPAVHLTFLHRSIKALERN